MTYLDIFAESVSHFTNIEKDFVINHFMKFICKGDCDAKLVHDVMWKKIPEDFGVQLKTKLKSGNLHDTMQFFTKCFDFYKQEVVRQSIMN